MRYEFIRGRPWPLLHFPRPWRVDDVAKRCGVCSASVAAWKQGRSRPEAHHLEIMLHAISPVLSPGSRLALFLAYGHVPTDLRWAAQCDPAGLRGILETLAAEIPTQDTRPATHSVFVVDRPGRSSILHSEPEAPNE